MKTLKKVNQQLKTKLIDNMRYLSTLLADRFMLRPKIKKCEEQSNTFKRVLVVGVVLGDRKNHYKHISSTLSKTESYEVKQIWGVIKAKKRFQTTENIEHTYFDDFIPRSKLINSLIESVSDITYDFIIIIDDDIRLPKHFLEQFLIKQETFNFSLAQPARTPESIISHEITKQDINLSARETFFVEIGPVVSIRIDAQEEILPLDEDSPMGWGLDYVWPALLGARGLKMGIIDATPIAHTLRPVGKSYDGGKAMLQMGDFLFKKPHLSENEAHVVIQKFK